MIIFLDFDGVLHPEPCFDDNKLFCSLPKFEGILRDFPRIQVVISSTWRESRTLEVLREFFSAEYRHRIIGVTPVWHQHSELFDIIGYQRQTEIEAWLRSSSEPWSPWIAIDDKSYLFRPFQPNLIKTESTIGIDESVEMRLRTLLANT